MRKNENNAVGRHKIHARSRTVRWHRLAVLLTIVALVLAASTSIAGASADSRVNGSVTGQAPFDFGTACSFVHQRYITTVNITRGPSAKLLVDTCVDFGTNAFVINGTFTFTAPSGTLTGVAKGTASETANPVPVDLTLTVSHGTHGFGHTSGTLHLAMIWKSNQVNGGPVTGTLTASLKH